VTKTIAPTFAERYFTLGDAPGAIGELLESASTDAPDRVFLGFGDSRLTFSELNTSATSIAGGLSALGAEPGERIAYFAANSLPLIEVLFGAWRMGSVNVPLNAFLRGKALAHQLTDSGARTLVVDASGLETVIPLLDNLSELTRLVLVEQTPTGGIPERLNVTTVEDLRATTTPSIPPEVDIDSPAAFVYTSGTTGLPKACVLSHRYFHHLGKQGSAAFDIVDDDSFYSVSPIYHLSAFIPMMAALDHRIAIIFDAAFSASEFLGRVRELGSTLLLGVGFYAFSLLQQPAREIDRDHRMRAICVAPLSAADRAEFTERFGIGVIAQVYGQTEVSMATMTPLGAPEVAGSAGQPSPWVTLNIADDQCRILPQGEVGEIVIRPNIPGVTYDGYWNRPDATIKASKNLWHHTGDLGILDEEGYLTFVGRKSDSIRRRGENVSAFQVEQILIGHPKILDAAVHAVRLPDESEDTIKACLVLAPETTTTAAELGQFFQQELAYFAVPRFVELFDELPRNASGRVVKLELAKRSLESYTWDLVTFQQTAREARNN
jgi:crotonobetaine/carnitine-CoA ligase